MHRRGSTSLLVAAWTVALPGIVDPARGANQDTPGSSAPLALGSSSGAL